MAAGGECALAEVQTGGGGAVDPAPHVARGESAAGDEVRAESASTRGLRGCCAEARGAVHCFAASGGGARAAPAGDALVHAGGGSAAGGVLGGGGGVEISGGFAEAGAEVGGS